MQDRTAHDHNISQDLCVLSSYSPLPLSTQQEHSYSCLFKIMLAILMIAMCITLIKWENIHDFKKKKTTRYNLVGISTASILSH